MIRQTYTITRLSKDGTRRRAARFEMVEPVGHVMSCSDEHLNTIVGLRDHKVTRNDDYLDGTCIFRFYDSEGNQVIKLTVELVDA